MVVSLIHKVPDNRHFMVSFILVLSFLSVLPSVAQITEKPRTIVTTDGEVDDMDSFIRLLLYSNDLDIAGLVYSSSMWHYAGDGKGTLFTSEMQWTKGMYGARTDLRWCGTTWMQDMIGEYAKVYKNLVQHDPAYPDPEYLQSIVRVGNIDFEGEMEKETGGSEFIKHILLDGSDEPVYVQVWGGTNTLARALKSIEDEYKGKPGWDELYKEVSAKTVIYIILDQDATYKNYIEPNWPLINTVYNSTQFWSFAYSWPQAVPASQLKYLQGEWMADNIVLGHGPLLAGYYTWGDGRKIAGDPEHKQGNPDAAVKSGRTQYDFISEGDSPSYLYLLNFGIQNYSDPSFGGPGGRFVMSADNSHKWTDGPNVTDFNPETGKEEPTYPQARWTEILQKDMAARADWCILPFNQANHAPVVTIERNEITAAPGETVSLKATCLDPDGDDLSYCWWNYKEAGTYLGIVSLKEPGDRELNFLVPDDAGHGQTIHMIVQAVDIGIPDLTGFGRVVIHVK